MVAAVKTKRPYAVVIDRKMAGEDHWPDGTGPPPERFESSFSDTVLRRKFSLRLPAGIPQLSFSEDGDGRLAFSLFGPEEIVSGRAPSRLADAIRHSNKTVGKKLKTVLIIDDEPALLELLTLTLLQEGFKVLRASNGRRGVELATSYLPDVIILDFSMPEFDGTEVVEQLRAHPRTKDIPILINTGTVLDEKERQHLAGHIQAIASKTDRQSLLAELVRLDAMNAAVVTTGANS
jgi:CheY-like chemotaxis protein